MPMETVIEQNNEQLTISQPSKQLSRWIGEELTILAEAFGETLTQQRVTIYVANLVDIRAAQLAVAFRRALLECRFFPKISELRQLAGASPDEQQDAEARKAWDVLTGFVKKYVSNDVYGNYGPEHGWYPRSYPKLSDRMLDTVRRTGGWRVYTRMTDEDFPFVQKRFFEEYAAWTAVEQIRPERMLATADALKFKALAAGKGMP